LGFGRKNELRSGWNIFKYLFFDASRQGKISKHNRTRNISKANHKVLKVLILWFLGETYLNGAFRQSIHNQPISKVQVHHTVRMAANTQDLIKFQGRFWWNCPQPARSHSTM